MQRACEAIRRPRRRGQLQQLHEVLSRLARPVSLRQLCRGAAGDDAAAALVLLQSLRHVELDAHHRRAAQHLLGVQAGAPSCRANKGIAELFLRAAAQRRSGRAQPTSALHAGPTSSSASTGCIKMARALGPATRSPAVRSKRAADWMRRALPRQRRPRRHLSADDLHRHQPALPRRAATTRRRCNGR